MKYAKKKWKLLVAKVTDNNRLTMNWKEKNSRYFREFLDTNGIRKNQSSSGRTLEENYFKITFHIKGKRYKRRLDKNVTV